MPFNVPCRVLDHCFSVISCHRRRGLQTAICYPLTTVKLWSYLLVLSSALDLLSSWTIVFGGGAVKGGALDHILLYATAVSGSG